MSKYTAGDLIVILERDFLRNPDAFSDGRRNDDAVDLCCICRALRKDPYSELDCISANHKWSADRYNKALEHVDRVAPYSRSWSNPGNLDVMSHAINY